MNKDIPAHDHSAIYRGVQAKAFATQPESHGLISERMTNAHGRRNHNESSANHPNASKLDKQMESEGHPTLEDLLFVCPHVDCGFVSPQRDSVISHARLVCHQNDPFHIRIYL